MNLISKEEKKRRHLKREEPELTVSVEDYYNKRDGESYPGGFDHQLNKPMGTRLIDITKRKK